MPYPAQRARSGPWRGPAVLLLIVGAAIAAVLWVDPFRPIPAELRLALAGPAAARPGVLANAGQPGEARFPLVLVLENRGGRVARPIAVDLSVPAAFRISSSRGPLARAAVPGDPLVRYHLPVPEREVAPDAPAQPLVPGDTLWLEAPLPDYHCVVQADSVPEFVPAPAVSAAALADVPVYYSFADAAYRGRDAGLLEVRLDSAALVIRPAPLPPGYPTQVREPEVPRPELGLLRGMGTRRAECGDPQQPLELFTVTWETAGGGRFLVVYVNGAPRKQLFDLDRDSIIELELSDPDADGRFETRREARYAIPPFLLPERPPVLAAADSLAAGPGWEVLFADTARGPFRFAPDSMSPASLRPVRTAVDSAWVSRFNDVSAGPYRFAPDSVSPPALRLPGATADTAWVRRFDDVAAGPFRFSTEPPPLRTRPQPAPGPRAPLPPGTPVPDRRGPGDGR